MHIIPRLDLMIAYSCNISCKGCISLSDFPRNGVASLEDIEDWCSAWCQVLTPKVITLFGGEPLVHPRFMDVCRSVRSHWPNSTIRLITNGYLLSKYNPADWFNFGPFEIQVSMHRSDHRSLIDKQIKQILLCYNDWEVSAITHTRKNEHKQISWARPNFEIYKSKFGEFIAPYSISEGKLINSHSDPAQAHSICGAPDTPVLFKGKLYKCPAVANVIDYTQENWYEYQALDYTDNLDEFISNIGKPELVCGQCPTRTQAVVYNHLNLENVIVKQKSIRES